MYIDIVTGVFESGKTSLIKKLIEKEASKLYKNILVINCEWGEVDYENFGIEGLNIDVVNLYGDDFNEDSLNSRIEEFSPDYVIVEYNGVWDLSDILSYNFYGKFNIRNVISVVDCTTFNLYIKNMDKIMAKNIANSDIVVLSKSENTKDNESEKMYKTIRGINKGCKVFLSSELFYDDESDIIKRGITKSDFELVKFMLYFLALNILVFGIKLAFPDFFADNFQRIIGISISLLIQILPFLLVGAIISSLIQIFVPRGAFEKIFMKSSFGSVIYSAFAGVFFPVCDCAMVPIATSIVKRGYSAPGAITFLLASPAVNPIVILSTYYAFPANPKVVIYRSVFGLGIAILTGLIMLILEKRGRENIVSDYFNEGSLLEDSMFVPRFSNWLKYFELIAMHTKKELFKIGFYITIGVFISSTIQVMVPKYVFGSLNNINSISVIVMIVAAFFISVCSTSNAFIARSFITVMPANSLLAFMVMGPMLDVTNVSVMASAFKKKFLLKLIVFLVYVSFMIFSILGSGFSLI